LINDGVRWLGRIGGLLSEGMGRLACHAWAVFATTVPHQSAIIMTVNIWSSLGDSEFEHRQLCDSVPCDVVTL